MNKLSSLHLSVAVMILSGAFVAFAQDAPDAQDAVQGAPLQEPAQLAVLQENNPQVPERVQTDITVTARRFEEEEQEVPIPVSVVSGGLVDDAGAFNVNRLQQLVPTVQFFSTNPRNTGLNIRGLGTTFGLTNDGVEIGVGLYVDGVFYARPAAGTLDFIDVEQIEVLRGPQGTLFGKNTTAGAILVRTRQPQFTPESRVELSYGSYGFIQAKASITGPLIGQKVAGRLSFSGTQRDGLVYNVATQDDLNDLNNLGVRGQLLIVASDRVVIKPSVDFSRQRPEGYAQVIAGVAPTAQPANRQFPAIAADLGYTLPSSNPFDRVIDTDTPWRSGQDLGGVSLNIDIDLGPGLLTSTTSWRYWNWDPSNDRDWTGLSVTARSAAPSKHRNWTQEIRYAGTLSSRLNAVVGFFTFGQQLDSDPFHVAEAGVDTARYALNPTNPLSATPGLLDGYGENTRIDLNTTSSAVFGQLEWAVTNRFRILPGLRFNYDRKDMDFERTIYGGLQTDDPALIALQRGVYSPIAYSTDTSDTNVSGQLSLAFQASEGANLYVTYATAFKPIGLNLGGVPLNAQNQPALDFATLRPEDVRHIEFGIKTTPAAGVTANIAFFNTAIRDFQTQVQNAQLGVLRGYLANAEKVRARGFDFDGRVVVNEYFSFHGAVAYNDAKYISFPDAPRPFEQSGLAGAIDISGGSLPGVSKWAGSFGVEAAAPGSFLGRRGEFFGALDGNYRSSFSSSPSPSEFLVVDGYALLNPRVGFRTAEGWSLFLWARNALDKEYFEQLAQGAGGSGLYQAQLGDQRTYGVTLRAEF